MLNLKISLLNAENLFLLFDQQLPLHFEKLTEAQWQKLSTSTYDNKPLQKVQHIAQTILEMNPDILQLVEVGGLESLKNFNHYFLNDQYSPILIEGNSDRNIDVGFLIRKSASFYFDLLTHKNRPLNFLYPHEIQSLKSDYPTQIQSHRFSRDCAELRLFNRDVNQPFLILLLTHLKSPLDPERIDPHGTERRRAEFKTCLEIYKELQNEFPDCPIIFSGDFNGQASLLQTDDEFRSIHTDTDLKDIFDLKQIPLENRSTFYQIKSGFRSEGRQIDYCFVSKHLQSPIHLARAEVFKYKDEFGTPLKKPETLEQKMRYPSDHLPILLELDHLKK